MLKEYKVEYINEYGRFECQFINAKNRKDAQSRANLLVEMLSGKIVKISAHRKPKRG